MNEPLSRIVKFKSTTEPHATVGATVNVNGRLIDEPSGRSAPYICVGPGFTISLDGINVAVRFVALSTPVFRRAMLNVTVSPGSAA
jgi:hypothetical protein